MEAEGTLVGGGGRADGSRGNHQRVVVTRWWWWKGRWRLGNCPTSCRDSLVVVGGRKEAGGTVQRVARTRQWWWRPDGSRGSHQRVIETRWWWWGADESRTYETAQTTQTRRLGPWLSVKRIK